MNVIIVDVDIVSGIIKKRKRGALAGLIIVSVGLVAAADSNTVENKLIIIIAAAALLIPLAIVYGVNVLNYPVPKPYYRTFNKVVYIYASKLVIILSIFSFLLNVKRAVNPLEGGFEGGREVPSKASDMLEAGVSAGLGYQMYRRLKPAEAIEQYFAAGTQASATDGVQPIPEVSRERPSSDTTASSRQ